MAETIAYVSAVIALLSAVAAFYAAAVSRRASELQIALSQGQLILPLWQYISTVSHIDPSNPVDANVRNTVNTLELVAVCWEAKLVDNLVLERVFAVAFRQLCDEIVACQMIPSFRKTGQQLLDENPAIKDVLEHLRKP